MEPALGLLCLVVGGILVALLIIVIFYLLTLQKALSRVAPHNRLMEPGSVWLMLVPCVNIVWQFIVATRLPDSLRNEFRERREDDGSDYGKGIALTQAILGLVSSLINGFASATRGNGQPMAFGAAIVVLALGLIGFVLFIVFWVRVANYSAMLGDDHPGRRRWERRLDDFDDDEDRGQPDVGPRLPPPETFREGDPGAIK